MRLRAAALLPILLTASAAVAQQPRLGVAVEEGPHGKGAVVMEVFPGSPAQSAGVAAGDVILRVGKKDIADLDAFTEAFEGRKPGEVIEIVLRRGPEGERKTLEIRLAEAKPDDVPTARRVRRAPLQERGAVRVEPEPEKRAAFLGVQTEVDEGEVVVRVVTPDTGASRAGIRAGDVIVSVEGEEVASPEELREAIVSRKPGDALKVTVKRDGETRELTAKLGRAPMVAEMVPMPPALPVPAEPPDVFQIHPVPPAEMAGLRHEIANLREELSALKRELSQLKKSLKTVEREKQR
jgi:S1-C subfamily serine protease